MQQALEMFYFHEARDRLNSAKVIPFGQAQAELVLHLPPTGSSVPPNAEPGGRVVPDYSSSAQRFVSPKCPKICEDPPSQGLEQQNQNRLIASIRAQMHYADAV